MTKEEHKCQCDGPPLDEDGRLISTGAAQCRQPPPRTLSFHTTSSADIYKTSLHKLLTIIFCIDVSFFLLFFFFFLFFCILFLGLCQLCSAMPFCVCVCVCVCRREELPWWCQ